METRMKQKKSTWDFPRLKGTVMNLKEIAYSHYLPAKRKRQAACKRYRSVAWNLLADNQVAQIDAYDAPESRDSQ